MKKSRIYRILIIAIVTLIFLASNNFFTKKMLVGKYVNTNFENSFIGENPHVEDTLVLFNNNQFYSPYYGKGNYKLSYGIDGTYIEMNYNVGKRETSFGTWIDRPLFFGNPRIILFEDLNQYYEKID